MIARDTSATARTGSRASEWTVSVAGILVLLVAWQLLESVLPIPRYILPLPTSIVQSMVRNAGLLLANTWPTVIEALGGFVVGNWVAVGLAVMIVWSKTLERTVYPIAILFRGIPIIAIAPIMVLWLGNGYSSKIAIAALISFFPTLVNVIKGLTSVDHQALELLDMFSASKSQVFRLVRWPYAMPYLFAALKIATTSSVLGAIVGEWIGSEQGLGYLVILATDQYRASLLFATLAISTVVALVLFGLVGAAEHVFVRWHEETRG